MPSQGKLEKWDQLLYDFLTRTVSIMPMRFVKLIAHYYTDARVRKLYWARLGITMGEGTFANLGLQLASADCEPRVQIGNHVSLAPNILFIVNASANNGVEINTLAYVQEHLTRTENIVVEDEAWIGANVTVMPGVRIGRCAVIGAGSVVTQSVSPYTVWAGAPARCIRNLKTGERYQ